LLVGDEGVSHIPAPRVAHVVDTTGAGDAFNAAFAVALASGCAGREAVTRGCVAGAWMVGASGVIPGMPTAAELAGSVSRSLKEVRP
jgi:ribokinase